MDEDHFPPSDRCGAGSGGADLRKAPLLYRPAADRGRRRSGNGGTGRFAGWNTSSVKRAFRKLREAAWLRQPGGDTIGRVVIMELEDKDETDI